MKANLGSITVEMQGGLGNQLFGWAAGYALSKRLGLNLTLDISNLISRPYELDAFKLSENIAISKNKRLSTPRLLSKRSVFTETSFRYDRDFEEIKRPKLIKGYFQSWKYFHSSREAIRSQLSLKEESEDLRRLLEIVGEYRVLAVHVRRGDYVGLSNYHGLTSDGYFKNAIELMENFSNFEKIMVFSDDIESARRMLPEANYFISSKELNSSPETITLMSRCESLIGSNSSFSWWAGFLTNDDSALRIFPRPWFANESLDSRDLLPAKWITLGI